MFVCQNKRKNENNEINLDQLMPLDSGGLNALVPENGIVLLSGEITEESAKKVIDQLFDLYLDDPAGERGITLIINSPGGDVYQTLAIIDTIKAIPTKVVGLAMGIAGSGAFYILQACDSRLMLNNSMLFWHEMISLNFAPITTTEESSRRHEEYMLLNQKLIRFLKERASISEEAWKSKFQGKNDLLFESQDAKKLNLIDGNIKSIKDLSKYFKDNIKYDKVQNARNDKRGSNSTTKQATSRSKKSNSDSKTNAT